MHSEKKIRLMIDSDLHQVEMIAIAVRNWCSLAGLSKQHAGMFELGVVEVINNVIEHAYKNEKGHIVELLFQIDKQKNLQVSVIDDGQIMQNKLEDIDYLSEIDANDSSTWMCSGYGLQIVKQVMDETNYCRKGDQNHFIMTRYAP